MIAKGNLEVALCLLEKFDGELADLDAAAQLIRETLEGREDSGSLPELRDYLATKESVNSASDSFPVFARNG